MGLKAPLLFTAGKAQVLEELQRKFETQAAVAELLNALQPSDGETSKPEATALETCRTPSRMMPVFLSSVTGNGAR